MAKTKSKTKCLICGDKRDVLVCLQCQDRYMLDVNGYELKSICEVDKRGNKRWYANNKFHRTDGPAIEFVNGTKYWFVGGKNHRVDGPSIEYASGDKFWYIDGKLHRADGPAIERANGDKRWYLNGKRYRADGPAIEKANGSKEWWINDKQFTEEEFKQWQKENLLYE